LKHKRLELLIEEKTWGRTRVVLEEYESCSKKEKQESLELC